MRYDNLYYEADIAIGLDRPVSIIFRAGSLQEAQERVEDPEGELREQVEDAMLAAGVCPRIRGWHNYQVLAVEVVRRYYRMAYHVFSASIPAVEKQGVLVVCGNDREIAARTSLDWIKTNEPLAYNLVDPCIAVQLERISREEAQKSRDQAVRPEDRDWRHATVPPDS